MKKFLGVIALFIIAGLINISCDVDGSSIVDTGEYEIKFYNESSYDVTVYSAHSSVFSKFTVKKGKTTTLRTDDLYIYFDHSNKDKVEYYSSGWGSSESRVVFRNIVIVMD